MFSHLKDGLTAAVKTSREYIFYPFVQAFFTDINIVNKTTHKKNTFFKQNPSLSEATEFVKAKRQNARLKTFNSKAFLLHIHEKSM